MKRNQEDFLRGELYCLLADVPSLDGPLSADARQWLQRAHTLVLAGDHTIEAASLWSMIDLLDSRSGVGERASRTILALLKNVILVRGLRGNLSLDRGRGR